MGVPKFYRWISERYPCLSEIVRDHQIPEFDNLYLDMNGIIHTCSHPDDGNVHFRITEEKIISDIFHYLEVLFRMIKPRKVFFMAVDGVAPRAKMNQQRSRRFRSAKEAEVLEAQAISKGQKLPTQARFDSNCITPGTEFMVRLHTQLQYFVVSKVSTDPLWKGVRIYLSGHETPGEGEHKIMDFIRSEKALPNYDTNTRHCLYGLDADLIMLGLTTHEPHFALLREEIRFGKQAQRRSTTVEDTVFHLLHISLLREYLELEFSCVKQYMVTFTFDLERIIDDWVLMGFLVGNDFIPHLPHLHIAHDALPTIWAAYKQILPRLGGYINDKGLINMARLESFIHELSEYDFDKFEESFADNQWMASKSEASKNRQRHGRRRQKKRISTNPDLPTGTLELPSSKRDSPDGCENQPDKPEVPSNGSAPGGLDTRVCLTSETQNGTSMELESFYDGEDSLEDGMMALEDMDEDGLVLPEREQKEQGMRYEFRKHKTQYYYEKMGLQTTAEVMQSQVRHYVTGLQWILFYYYQGVPSWGWFYPQHYAPFMSDLTGFADFDITFDPAQPFLPFQQLMAVLPAASGQLLPKPYRWLMTHPDSPIIHFYPAEFLTDMNGKQQDWEAVVLIPFIEEKLLIHAMSRVEGQLSASEAARNAHGPCLIYDWAEQSQGVYNSSLPSFPSIQQNHASVSRRTWRDFVVPPSRLSVAPAPSTTRFCPGFPTLAHLHHSTHLSQMGVTVFQQASRNDNRIVQILDDMDIDDIDIDSLADAYLGKSVWVNWPHLMEARAVGIETDTERVELVQSGPNKEETTVKTESDAARESLFLCKVESITETYMKRRGIDIGPTFVLLHATPISGRRYEYTVQSRVTISKLWQPVCQTYAIQATVTNEKMNEYGVDDVNSQQFFTLEQVFPIGSTAFLLSRSHYGCQAKVTGHSDGRIAVQYLHPREPNLLHVRRSHYSVRYLKSYEMAQTLGITSHFVSRLTGIMLMSRDRETLNIGLDLKNNKKQEECPGFSRLVVRESDGGSDWFYSPRVRDLMEQYLNRFPELCVYIQQNLSKDKLSAEEAFPENCKEKSDALLEFVRSLPTYKCPRVRAGGRFVEEPVVREIERTVDVMLEAPKQDRPKNMTVKPDQLYKSFSLSSTTLPDPHADFDLFDRVVNVRLGFTVPYGLRGTIIGIVTGPTNADTIFEVLFDAPFACGLTTRCSPGRGYRCPQHSLLNLSYGERAAGITRSVGAHRGAGSYSATFNTTKSNLTPFNQTPEKVDFHQRVTIQRRGSPANLRGPSASFTANRSSPRASPANHRISPAQVSTNRISPRTSPANQNTPVKSQPATQTHGFVTPKIQTNDARRPSGSTGKTPSSQEATPLSDETPQHADIWEKLKIIKSGSPADETTWTNTALKSQPKAGDKIALDRLFSSPGASNPPQTVEPAAPFDFNSLARAIDPPPDYRQTSTESTVEPSFDRQTPTESTVKPSDDRQTPTEIPAKPPSGFDFGSLVRALGEEDLKPPPLETEQRKASEAVNTAMPVGPNVDKARGSSPQFLPSRSAVEVLLEWTRAQNMAPPQYLKYQYPDGSVTIAVRLPSLNTLPLFIPHPNEPRSEQSAAAVALRQLVSGSPFRPPGRPRPTSQYAAQGPPLMYRPVYHGGVPLQGHPRAPSPHSPLLMTPAQIHMSSGSATRVAHPDGSMSAFVPPQVTRQAMMRAEKTSSPQTTTRKEPAPEETVIPPTPNIVGEEPVTQASPNAKMNSPAREHKPTNSQRKPKRRKGKLAANFDINKP